MATESHPTPNSRDDVLPTLNLAIAALNLAKEGTSVAPVKNAFTSARVLLTTIKDSVASKPDYVDLGLTCADVCDALRRGTDGWQTNQLSRPALEATEELTTIAAEIQENIIKRGKRNPISQRYRAKDDKEAIATWRLSLNGLRQVFNTELGVNVRTTVSSTHQASVKKRTVITDVRRDVSSAGVSVPRVRSDTSNTYRQGGGGKNQTTYASAPGESSLPPPPPKNTRGIALDIRRDVVSEVQAMVSDIRHTLKIQEGVDSKHRLVGVACAPSVVEYTLTIPKTQHGPVNQSPSTVAGELPPPPPRVFFGRGELIEQTVGFAQNLTPIALIGAGGIGKTSIALTALHDDRIKQRFGDNRWFIRCDQFPPTHTHLLLRLSKTIGADVQNLEDLTPLRRYLSSKEMVRILDNAESILDPQGPSAQEIYAIVDELTRFNNLCLCLTSRISTIPPSCETLEIPTLSEEAAHDTFYRIYKHGERCDSINDILKQLDFHPLSITLLATVAQYGKWSGNRLTREWGRQRTGMLRAQHSGSLAGAIELSLSSPMFRELGPDARALLEVVAFFPRGVDEENVDWLFSTVSDAPNMFDTFCILSLTYRTNGFITMLAPLRDYFRPRDPASSPLLSTAKERYFVRLSTNTDPDEPDYEEPLWITSEDVNVEHLLGVFTSLDPSSEIIWDACAGFLYYLNWNKPRLTTLGPKIEALSDNHPSKAQCLRALAFLFNSVGNDVESKRLHTCTLKLWREKGDAREVAKTLSYLSDTNRLLGLGQEAIQQAREASEIFERLGDTAKQAICFIDLAWASYDDGQLDAAEQAALHGIQLLPEDEQYQVCQGHRVLGYVHSSKGDPEEAVHHFQVALGIATSLDFLSELFWVHYSLADMFSKENRFKAAHDHIELAKSHTVDNAYNLGCAMELQAGLWFQQRMFGEAKAEASGAIEVYRKLGAMKDVEECRELLREIGELELDGELTSPSNSPF